MKIRKFTAAIAAAAVLAVAAPMTDVLPDLLSITASAASPDIVDTIKVTVDGVTYDDQNGIDGMEHTIKIVAPANKEEIRLNFNLDFDKIKSDKYVFDISCDAMFDVTPDVLLLNVNGSGAWETKPFYIPYTAFDGDIEPEVIYDIVAFVRVGTKTGTGKASFTIDPLQLPDDIGDWLPSFSLSVAPTTADYVSVPTGGSIEITIKKVSDTIPSEDDPNTSDSSESDTPNTFTDDSGDKAADIEVIAKPNVIPKEAYFSVRLDEANSTAERIAYNCYFTYNEAEYEPTDTVTVRIPVPIAMRDIADTLKVYHLQDGKYVNMNAKVENGYLVFETDHFSTYIVTAENLAEGGSTSTPSTSTPTTSDKGNPDTGVAAVAAAFGVAALAGAAVLVARKRRK